MPNPAGVPRGRLAAAVARGASARSLHALVALALVGQAAGAAHLHEPAGVALSRARVAPPAASSPPAAASPTAEPAPSARAAAVRRLLDQRAAALRRRDRAGFLALVDPRTPVLRARQAALYDALAAVPVGRWDYELTDDAAASAGTWTPRVLLRYSLAGYDETPVVQGQGLTFVLRGGRWLLGAAALPSPPALWDTGSVEVVRGRSSLVIGRPGSRPLLRSLAAEADAAVPRVSAVWGPGWTRTVVVEVPGSTGELARLAGTAGELTQIAALATQEQAGSGPGGGAGDRVLVNPPVFSLLSPAGRRVVITHEVTHVASRAATGPDVPDWLVEGLADYVGYRGVDLPPSVSSGELRAQVRRGELPAGLPTDAEFDGANPRLPAAYELAWLTVRTLVEQYGEDRVLAFYRAVGRSRGAGAAAAVDAALRGELGSSTDELTAQVLARLTRELGSR